MKNTKMRKKMLVSSIAMLMVATVSLGSATYAWFTANPKATASGLKLKTTASAGLEVKTQSDPTWSHAATLNAGATTFDLTPASQEQNTQEGTGTANKFWTIAAAEADKFGHDNTAKMSVANTGTCTITGTDSGTGQPIYSNPSGAVYAEKVFFKLTDGADASVAAEQRVNLTGVAIVKNTNATMQNAIKVAVADKDNVILGTYTLDTTTGETGNNGVLVADNDTNKAPTAGSFEPELTQAAATANAAASQELDVVCFDRAISTTCNESTDYVTVYVYLDGQHGDCYSENVGTYNAAEIISSISLNFELKGTPGTT